MPSMGEGIMEATVLSWLKKVGDKIEEDESVLEVATDKVDTEVPALHDGVIESLLVAKGEVVKIGQPLAKIRVSGEEETAANAAVQPALSSEAAQLPETTDDKSGGGVSADGSSRFYSPLVRSIAAAEKVDFGVLEKIRGTGKDGRVTKHDILQYLAEQKSAKTAAASAPVSPPSPQKPSEPLPQAEKLPLTGISDEVIEMDRMRKMIAERMVASKQISPHVTSFVEADLSAVVGWRNKVKAAFRAREGSNFTFTPIFVEAIAKAIADFPLINVSVEGSRIIKHGEINVGIAVALPTGNLIVPVIRNANHYNLTGLALKVNELVEKARKNKLKPQDIQGGTYTISNIGTFQNILGTPIIMQPQVAIMAFGTIAKKPVVVETPQGDVIAIRHRMHLSHSYDHRVVDGALGGMFVKRVADYLENFDTGQSV